MKYRRAFAPGASFFFTVVTHKRLPILAGAETVEVLRSALRAVRLKRPFEIDAMIVLPNHIHCIWTLPPDDADFSTRWRLVKTWFTKHCDPALRPTDKTQLWQHRYWEHLIRDERDFQNHVEYIHYNPIKHGLANSAIEWPYSSFHNYVKNGLYSADWGSNGVALEGIGQE